jgi:GNAT superfamily N-acetyltransferase
MIPLERLDDLADAADDDPLILWAAQTLVPPVAAWAVGSAVAVASPGLCCRDRLAVHGDPRHVATLVRDVLAEVGPTFRPLGSAELIERVVADMPSLGLVERFGWMQVAAMPAGSAASEPGRPSWLAPHEQFEVTALLDEAFPSSYARPGRPEDSRWAGIRDSDGRLVSVAADAWSSARVGLLAGVATRPSARGAGLAAATCRFVVSALLETRERVGLMVDDWNTSAIATYTRLGFTMRRLAAAAENRVGGVRR